MCKSMILGVCTLYAYCMVFVTKVFNMFRHDRVQAGQSQSSTERVQGVYFLFQSAYATGERNSFSLIAR